MTEESGAPKSGDWQQLDRTGDADAFVAYLDRGADVLHDSRMEIMRLLEFHAGCSVLDVGCGTGKFLIEVARNVEGVHAVGIDFSESMVKTATLRAHEAGVAVEFATGDAQRLDFREGSFDRVSCERVLVHLNDPAGAIGEMARVLVPGGRVAIVEPDHDALMIDSDNLKVARAVRRLGTAGLRNPDIGRRLRRLLLSSGLEILQLSGMALPVTSLQTAVDQFHLLDHLESAVKAGDVEADEAREWRKWLETADATDRFFVAPVLFHAVARKPLRPGK